MKKMMMIDDEKCVGCGACAMDCVSRVIRIEEGKARLTDRAYCILCGHCMAVCPENAVGLSSHLENERAEPFVDMGRVEFEKLNQLVSMKRSVRQFTKQLVEPELIQKVLETGRVSPTGGNRQPLKFAVVNSPEKMEELKLMVMNTLYAYRRDFPGRYQSIFENMLKNYKEQNYDRLFYHSTTLVTVYGDPDESSMLPLDSGIAAGQMTLAAETLGLGSCYIGFLRFAADRNEKISQFLKIPSGNQMIVNFVLGYPDVTYYRPAPRNALNVNYI